jgi:hypothetical protein
MRSAEESGASGKLQPVAREPRPASERRSIPSISSRVPPLTSAASPRSPGSAQATAVRHPASGTGPVQIAVENVDKKWLKAMWEDLCNQYPHNVPQDFKDVYQLVTSFRDNVFTFKPGDPHQYREKIANLLYLYGVENPDVRIE